jgi:hypothetical protein
VLEVQRGFVHSEVFGLPVERRFVSDEDIQITEAYIERVGIKIYDAGLPEQEAIRQTYHETKKRFGRVTEAIKNEYRRTCIDRQK